MMLSFKQKSLATNLGPYRYYRLAGLPDGQSCNVCPEDDERPRGPWFVSAERNGKARVIRCDSLKAAKEAAIAWAEGRPAKREKKPAKPKSFRAIMREAAGHACGGRSDRDATSGGPTHVERLPLTSRSFMLLYSLDRALVGTLDYMGMAGWWADEYKHTLRGASTSERKKAHDALLAAGLRLDGESDEHARIIARAAGEKRSRAN